MDSFDKFQEPTGHNEYYSTVVLRTVHYKLSRDFSQGLRPLSHQLRDYWVFQYFYLFGNWNACSVLLLAIQDSGRGPSLFYILATRLGPPAAYGVPMYLILDKLGLTNTHIAIILAHATFNLAIIVWMMKSFFDDVPREVEEAAFLDGCSPYGVFYQIALPLAFPGLVASAIFALIFSWNELFFSLILTSGETRTLPVMIPSLAQHTGTQWGQVAAASIIQSIPVLVFIFFIQKWLVQGLTFGAVKG